MVFIALSAYMLASSPHAVYDFPVDDAWIHRVYARSLAMGDGFSYNPGIGETGATSPLWVILTAPAHWAESYLNIPIAVAVKSIGGLLGLLAIWCVINIGKYFQLPTVSIAILGSLWAMEPRLLFSCYSGMEVILLTLFLLMLIIFHLNERKLLFSITMSILPLIRPEALLLIPIYASYDFFIRAEKNIYKIYLWIILTALPFGLWLLGCKVINDAYLPLTFKMKLGSLDVSAKQLATFFETLFFDSLFIPLGFLIGITILAFKQKSQSRDTQLQWVWNLIVTPTILFIATLVTRKVSTAGYFWLRFIEPFALILSVPAIIGIVTAFSRFNKRDRPYQRPLQIAAILALVVSATPYYQALQNKRFHLWSDAMNINIMNVKVGQWLKKNTPEDAVIGVNDAGAIRYFSERTVIDLLGLNSSAVAISKIPREELWNAADWLALYPSWFKSQDFKMVKPRKFFEVPQDEYSICPCPTQTKIGIFEKF